jgi:hypothetical protein
MRFLPSREDFALDAAPPLREARPAPAPASFPTVFIIGLIAILANALLALALAVWGALSPWIVLPFLGGLVPAALLARRCNAATLPILLLCAAAAGCVGLWTDIAPFGRIVDLSDATQAPAAFDVAGYVAPGWRIETAHAAESPLTGRRGKRIGTRTIAPLVGPAWTPKDPVYVWIAGYSYPSNKIGPRHPAHWSQPGEYPRLVGMDSDEAQDAAFAAAKAQGLVSAPNAVIVMYADDVRAAMFAQAVKLAEILGALLALWLLVAFLACRREHGGPKRGFAPDSRGRRQR